MKTNAFLYSSKVWFTAVFVGPFIQCLFDLITNQNYGMGFWVFFSISNGAIITIPSLLLFWLTMLAMNRLSSHPILFRFCISLAGILFSLLFIYLTYYLQQFTADGPYLQIPYILIVILSIWLYDLPILDRRRYSETINA